MPAPATGGSGCRSPAGRPCAANTVVAFAGTGAGEHKVRPYPPITVGEHNVRPDAAYRYSRASARCLTSPCSCAILPLNGSFRAPPCGSWRVEARGHQRPLRPFRPLRPRIKENRNEITDCGSTHRVCVLPGRRRLLPGRRRRHRLVLGERSGHRQHVLHRLAGREREPGSEQHHRDRRLPDHRKCNRARRMAARPASHLHHHRRRGRQGAVRVGEGQPRHRGERRRLYLLLRRRPRNHQRPHRSHQLHDHRLLGDVRDRRRVGAVWPAGRAARRHLRYHRLHHRALRRADRPDGRPHLRDRDSQQRRHAADHGHHGRRHAYRGGRDLGRPRRGAGVERRRQLGGLPAPREPHPRPGDLRQRRHVRRRIRHQRARRRPDHRRPSPDSHGEEPHARSRRPHAGHRWKRDPRPIKLRRGQAERHRRRRHAPDRHPRAPG